jgi:hypothetical protein
LKITIDLSVKSLSNSQFFMKLTLITPALVAILGLALASAPVTVQAQTTAAPAAAPTTAPAAAPTAATAPKAPKAKKPTPYDGALTTIAADGTSIVVTSSKKTLTLAIDAKTTFLKDKKAATLADFAVGDKVTGSYTVDATSGAMTAHSLHKMTPKKAAAKPAAKTPAAAATPATPAAPAAPATN